MNTVDVNILLPFFLKKGNYALYTLYSLSNNLFKYILQLRVFSGVQHIR